MLGVRIGRRVFDDGCSIPEKTLVTIGDDACSTPAASCSATRWRTAASSPTTPSSEPARTIGVDTFVHYGVTMGEGAVLEADAFLMKGESMAPFAIWRGNPATEVRVAATPTAAPTVPLRIVPSPPASQARPAATPPAPRPVRTHAAVRPGHVPFIDFLAGAGTASAAAGTPPPAGRSCGATTS